jgi:hypothetical protein
MIRAGSHPFGPIFNLSAPARTSLEEELRLMVYMEKIAPPERLPGSREPSHERQPERAKDLSGERVDASLKKLVTTAVRTIGKVASVTGIHKAPRHRSG